MDIFGAGSVLRIDNAFAGTLLSPFSSKPGSAPSVLIAGSTISGASIAVAVCRIDSGAAAAVVCAGKAESTHEVMMKVIRLNTNKEAIFLCITFSILVYFIVYLLGKNQKIGEGKFRYVDGLRVNVSPGWKRQDTQQVGEVFRFS